VVHGQVLKIRPERVLHAAADLDESEARDGEQQKGEQREDAAARPVRIWGEPAAALERHVKEARATQVTTRMRGSERCIGCRRIRAKSVASWIVDVAVAGWRLEGADKRPFATAMSTRYRLVSNATRWTSANRETHMPARSDRDQRHTATSAALPLRTCHRTDPHSAHRIPAPHIRWGLSAVRAGLALGSGLASTRGGIQQKGMTWNW
jgi:hypothetical protein